MALSLSVILAGCGHQRTKQDPAPADPNQLVLPVEIVGGGEFPSFLTGDWKEDGVKNRKFEFSSDGNLQTMWFWLSQAPIKHNATVEMPLREGGKGRFKSGQWHAQYNPFTRQLEIEIVIESFSLEIPNPPEKLEGSVREYYFGPISEDGTRWDVDYTGFLEIYATTEEVNKKPLHNPDEVVEETITFYKVMP
ncbi:MAG: hypothetical protein ACYSPI_12105 [Planctomycetota bacterium]|jgi:hypothetical protein